MMTRAVVGLTGAAVLCICALVFRRMDGLEWIPWGLGAFYGALAAGAAFIPEMFE